MTRSTTIPANTSGRIQLILTLCVVWALTLCPPLKSANLHAEESGSLRWTSVVRAIQAAEPAVVNIEGNKPAKSGTQQGPGEGPQVNGMGAGVIIDSRGFILTNQHVVQDVKRIDVTLHDGRQHVGKLIARDPETDLALVKIESEQPLPVIRCGTSSDLMRGERVIAIGNPFGYHHTVTEGIISALHRDIPVNGVHEYPDLIQTDASINPGNSGGPLLNADGEMIGVNAAVRIGAQGIGFAIPIDRAVEIAARMIAQYRQPATCSLEVKTEYQQGVSKLRVVKCESGNLQPNDVICEVNGKSIRNRMDYELALVGLAPDQDFSVVLQRGSQQFTSRVKMVGIHQVAQTKSGQSSYRLASSGNDAIQERVYQELGIRLEVANRSRIQSVDPTYQGGMLVTAVRPDSPAHKAPIQRGDILVGLLGWQTTNWNDLSFIMNSEEMSSQENPEFRIIRGSKLYWSNLELQSRKIR
jgi:serine protease Do